jgi:hypothetical protein
MVISFLELVKNQKSEIEDHLPAAGTPKAFGVRWADFGLRLRAGLAVSDYLAAGFEPATDGL